MGRLNEAARAISAVICLVNHPVYRVSCMRNRGHDGLHFFQARWANDEDAQEMLRAALRAMSDDQA